MPIAAASFQGRPLRALLFDLDGTLLDTAGDIALALRRALAEQQLPAPDDAAVRRMIGRGAPMLVERALAALGLALDAAAQPAIVDGFFAHYGALQDSGESAAMPYAGVVQGLRQLSQAGLPMAVVTNKQQRFAQALLGRLGLAQHFELIVGGDSCERRKPDPQPLLWACTQLGVPAAQALMVGDSINDVIAARAAAVAVVCVPYGYNEGRPARSLPCDNFIESIDELPALIGLRLHCDRSAIGPG
jgi:phosphoglycolate phosphatase